MNTLKHGLAWRFCLFRLFVLSWAMLASTSIVQAAPPSSVYPDDSDMAETMLRTARANEADKQWAEAADIYTKVLQEFGARTIRLPDEVRSEKAFLEESRRWVNLREYVLALMARWPAEGRAALRERTDTQAATIWSRATDPDTAPDQARDDLARLAFSYYLSSYGDKAMERLGDIAFQAGRFQESAQWYARLARRSDAPAALPETTQIPAVHPAPTTDNAVLEAKLALALYAAGQLSKADQVALVKAFSARFPQNRGSFAGRSGLIAESLLKAMAEDQLLRVDDSSAENWPTFAGASSRNRVVGDAVGLGARQWRVSIDPITTGRANFQGMQFQGGFGRRGMMPRNLPVNPNRNQGQPLLAYHPIVVGDQVIVCNDRRVMAFNLNESARPDGSVGLLWRQEFEVAGRPQGAMIASAAPRMTLTARSGRIFARMGETGVSLEFGNRMSPSNAFLVALDLHNKGQVVWRVQGTQIPLPQPNGNDAPAMGTLEGTPVADEKRVYCVITLPGHQTSNYIAALSAETGEVAWVRYLFDAPNPFDLQAAMMGYQANHAHHLLTLAENKLFYQSDSGAVASLDPDNGQLNWLTAYPKRDGQANPGVMMTSRRDLNPAVFAEGKIYVAPSDSPHLFALDAESGSILWKSAPLPDIVHLIGVGQGNLFATGDRVWTLDAATGRIVRSWPDTGSGYEIAGRGLLAGSYLYWPTANEIHILDQKTGLRSDRGSIRLRERFQTAGGNLALGDGYLVVAGTDHLSVFTQNSKLIRRYEQMIAANPEAATPRYRLATVAESLNEPKIALNALRVALTKVKPEERLDGQSLSRLVTDRLYKLLIQEAGRTRQTETALELLKEAAEKAIDPLKKEAAMVLHASVLMEKGETATAFRELARLTARASAYEGLWSAESNYEVNLAERSRRLMLAAWSKLSDAERRSIRSEEAAELEKKIAAGINASFAPWLRSLAPGPTAARAWLAWAERLIQLDDKAAAADALAHAELQKSDEPVFVAALGRLKQSIAPGASQTVTLPTTQWLSSQNETREMMVAIDHTERSTEVLPTLSAMVLAITKTGQTELLSLNDGSPVAKAFSDLGKPLWSGVVSGRGLIFDGEKLVGLNPSSGSVYWRLPLGGPERDDWRKSPFSPPRPAVERTDQNPEKQAASANPDMDRPSGWWLIQARQGRLMVQNQEGHVWRVDPLSGRVLWHRFADASSIGFAFLAGPHVLLRDGSTVLVLDADSGAMTRSMDTGTAGSEWSREPLVWDDHRVVLSPDRLNLAMIDLNRGERVWTWQATAMQPHNGPPRFFRHADTLVAIADGETAVRLNPKNGEALWRAPLGDVDHSRDEQDVLLDEKRLYFLESQDEKGVRARALNLTDGSLAWQTSVLMAGQSWSFSKGGSGLGGILIGPENDHNRRLASGMVQVMDTAEQPLAPRQSYDPSASMVLLNPAEGVIVQRFVSPISGEDVSWSVPDWNENRLFMGGTNKARVALIKFGDPDDKSGKASGKNR